MDRIKIWNKYLFNKHDLYPEYSKITSYLGDLVDYLQFEIDKNEGFSDLFLSKQYEYNLALEDLIDFVKKHTDFKVERTDFRILWRTGRF